MNVPNTENGRGMRRSWAAFNKDDVFGQAIIASVVRMERWRQRTNRTGARQQIDGWRYC